MNAVSGRLPGRNAEFWPIAGLTAVAMLTLFTLFRRSINWDEYWFLSQVNELAQHRLTRPLQTIHTRLFAWLTHVPGNDIDALIAGRLGMFACLMVIAAAIVGIATRFAGRNAALFAALAYLSGGYVFQHGYSFRVDPLATALLMSALWALLALRLNPVRIIGIAFLIGLAAMVTIKVVLYAPVFAGVMWLRWNEAGRSRDEALRIIGTGLAAAAWFGLIFLYHRHDLAQAYEGAASNVLRTSAGYMFQMVPRFYWPMVLKAATTAPVLTLMILAFPFVLRRHAGSAAEKVALAGFFAPLATLLFYHNTAAYYYTFMLAPVCVAVAVVVPYALHRFRAPALAGVLAVNPLAVWVAEPQPSLPAQRTIAAAAEQLFPQPIGYFDKMAMLPSLAKHNMFMTKWGIDLYLTHEVPGLAETMAREAVPLVVENNEIFTQALRGTENQYRVYRDEDIAVLRSNYVHFWGPFWLAGRDVPVGSEPVRFDLAVPGRFTIQQAPLVLDGVEYQPGTVVQLARGTHVIGGGRKAAARLIWGDNLRAPTYPAPTERLFIDF